MRNGCYVCSVSSPPNPAIETVVRTHSEAEAIYLAEIGGANKPWFTA